MAADPVGGFNPLYSILQSILTLQYFTPPVGLLGGGTHYSLAVVDIVYEFLHHLCELERHLCVRVPWPRCEVAGRAHARSCM